MYQSKLNTNPVLYAYAVTQYNYKLGSFHEIFMVDLFISYYIAVTKILISQKISNLFAYLPNPVMAFHLPREPGN